VNPDLLQRLDKILNELNDAIDQMDPDGNEAGLLFEPTQELGWAVDELLGRHKRKDAVA
jgi:hypothetical protein